MKKIIKNAFNFLGIEVKKIPPKPVNQYFNTGDLTPLEENSVDLYDKFYSDKDALDSYYQDFRIRFYREVIDLVEGEGITLDNKRILDVGCGVGYLVAEIGKRCKPGKLSGCDFSQAAVSASQSRFPDIEFFQQDISSPLPVQNDYDIIFCTEVLEHLEYPHLALQHLSDGLRAGGVLVLTVPDGRLDNLTEHINFWSPESWKVFLNREIPDASIKSLKLSIGNYNFAIVKFSMDE